MEIHASCNGHWCCQYEWDASPREIQLLNHHQNDAIPVRRCSSDPMNKQTDMSIRCMFECSRDARQG